MSARFRTAVLSAVVAVVALCAACGTHSTAPANDATMNRIAVTPTLDAQITPPTFDPSAFASPKENPYFPLRTGAQWTYEGDSRDGHERNVVLVTGDTRMVLDVSTIVVHDQVWIDDVLVEDTFDYYAADKDGNVWYFGEDVSEYENGQVVNHDGSWLAGVDGALPGYALQAAPEVGEAYAQEEYPGVAEDRAKVVSLDESVTVPWGPYDHVIQTLEWTPLEPGHRGYKYYAAGIGMIKELSRQRGGDVSELVAYSGP